MPGDAECELISQANNEYSNGNYDDCLKSLDLLESAGINVKLNRSVVLFYKSGCKDYKTLLKNLEDIHNSEARASKPIVLYNIAVVYFHRHMFVETMDTLFPLLDKIDTLDVNVAAPIGILMLRSLLATNQFVKARRLLEMMQLKLGIDATDSLNSEENNTALPELFSGTIEMGKAFKLIATLTHVLNRKSILVPEDSTVEYSALKAHQYYIMKDFQMAAKQLKKISDDNYQKFDVDELNTCVSNNMGVIQMRVRHYAIASKFFQKAITFDKKISANLHDAPLQKLSSAHSCEILYNLGLSMLHLRRPKEAFQCFLTPLKTYHDNPRLWFRIAEACIMEHEMKNSEIESHSLRVLLSAARARRKLTLKPKPKVLYPSGQSAAVPETTLEFAALCLRNALMLTTSYRNSLQEGEHLSHDASGSTKAWYSVRDSNVCNPSKPMSKDSLDNMLTAIYAAYSYVSLRIGDYVKAYEMALELLKQDRLSDAHKMLGHMYVGEALIMLERPHHEARPYLEQHLESLNAFDFETKDWQVKSLDAAQDIVRYNLAVAMVMQGDLDVASNLLSACKHNIVSAKIINLKMHIELRKVAQ